MKLSEHFSLDELTASQTAAREGIDNSPGDLELKNMIVHLVPGLESVRHALGDRPITITSGFRSKALNAKVPGSSDSSAHTQGYAADFICPSFGTPWDICNKLVMTDLAFDQLIFEYGQWVHLSMDPRARRVILTKLSGQPYRNGLHKE